MRRGSRDASRHVTERRGYTKSRWRRRLRWNVGRTRAVDSPCVKRSHFFISPLFFACSFFASALLARSFFCTLSSSVKKIYPRTWIHSVIFRCRFHSLVLCRAPKYTYKYFNWTNILKSKENFVGFIGTRVKKKIWYSQCRMYPQII